MHYADIANAKKAAEEFIEAVDLYELESEGHPENTYQHPATMGVIRARSLILSRLLAAMRDPWNNPRSRFSIDQATRKLEDNKKGKK